MLFPRFRSDRPVSSSSRRGVLTSSAKGRLGRVWTLVSGFFLEGASDGLEAFLVFRFRGCVVHRLTGRDRGLFFISLLLASGFLLTGQWFCFR